MAHDVLTAPRKTFFAILFRMFIETMRIIFVCVIKLIKSIVYTLPILTITWFLMFLLAIHGGDLYADILGYARDIANQSINLAKAWFPSYRRQIETDVATQFNGTGMLLLVIGVLADTLVRIVKSFCIECYNLISALKTSKR